MTDEEKQAALAYIKLHEDVKQLITETIASQMVQPTSSLVVNTRSAIVHCYELEQKIKQVVRDQMMKL